MANYGYGYGNFTSQPQQYTTGTYVTPNTGTYQYSTQPASRVVQGYQTAGTTAYGAATGYAQQQATVPAAAATGGGYGYFQRASDQNSAAYVAATQKTTNYATSQAYGYANTAVKAASYAGGTTVYQKPQAYVAPAASTTFTGYTVQRPTSATPSYNNTPSYQKPKPAATQKPQANSHQNAYEKVVYNAATTFLSQQSGKSSWNKNEKPTFKLQNQKGLGWSSNKSQSQASSKPQQLHYCEVCKISCAGPQTYKEHLEGQKHKKKAASSTSDVKNLPPGTYKCELCDVVCTGKDAFTAHVKGASHTKTMKLHQKLGKAIPEIKLPEVTPKKTNVVKTTAPKINFVGGTKLASTNENNTDVAATDGTAAAGATEEQEIPTEGEAVGEQYVEDVKSDVGKIIGFKCTICDCRFNDAVAKNAHVKGKRHKLSFKKKVDPSYQVDVKINNRQSRDRRGSTDPSRQEMLWKQRQQEQIRWEQELRLREEELRRWEHEEFMRRASEDRYWTRPDRNRMHELEYYEWERREKYVEPQNVFGPPQGPPPPSADDRLIMAKHGEIYPTEVELKQVQSLVASAEKALKLVSDSLGDDGKEKDAAVKTETGEAKDEKKPEPLLKDNSARMLKGVMRVGALAKGLLLRGQLSVELVVLCAYKPTYTLLKHVGKLVPDKLKEASPDEKYNLSISSSECAIIISSTTEPKCTVKVVLTSPAMREEDEESKTENGEKKAPIKKEPVDPKDVLDKEKALQALASLRRAKWFQARANHLTSCVITIRVLRDICNRVPAFKPLNGWAIELLCEKALSSNFQPLGPGEAFRRVLEVIASGIFLPGGNGLLDPCEKEKTDASTVLGAQEREDITGAAQQALRLHAFRQLHKILGVEPLKPTAKNSNKRAANDSTGEETANKAAKKE